MTMTVTVTVTVTYIPLPFECLQVAKRPCDRLVGETGLVLLEQSTACLRIVRFRDGVFQVGLFERIQSDDDAVDLGERIIQIPFGVCRRQLDFLRTESATSRAKGRETAITSSRLMVADSVDRGT